MVRFRYNFYLQSSKHAANYFVKQHRESVAFSLKHFLRLPQQKNMYNDFLDCTQGVQNARLI